MDSDIVQSLNPVTLVGGAEFVIKDATAALALAPTLIAADGGANACVANGFLPTAVIGDFDSIHEDTRAALTGKKMIEISEQDSTDFEKCLSRIDAPFILATGFAGDRLDHGLVALSVLSRRLGPPTFLIGPDDFAFAAPKTLSLPLSPGTRVSLFPMAPMTGTSTGLKWPINGLNLDPMGRTGTSNEATGPVNLTFDAPGCLVILPRAALPQAIQALTG